MPADDRDRDANAPGLGVRDPDILIRLTAQLAERGVADARAVAIERLTLYGILDHRGTLTPYGRVRDRMTPAERAIDRAAERSGRDPADYVYNARTNRATLRRR